MSRALAGLLALTLLAAAGYAGWSVWKAAAPVEAGDDYGPLPDFALTERGGRTVTRADLLGKVWVAACIFTCCTESCPQISGQMARLQHDLAGQADVALVSISVDPEHDTTEQLKTYADKYGADPDRWLFLTGSPDAVYGLIRDGFHLGAGKNEQADAGSRYWHSNKVVLVDRRGHLRGYFDATRDEEMTELRQRIARLVREKP